MQIVHCCGATLLLFKRQNFPIFPSEQFSGRWPEFKKERETAMFASIVRFVRAWRRHNQSMRELSRLGDRELADIGISRSDIPRVAWGGSDR